MVSAKFTRARRAYVQSEHYQHFVPHRANYRWRILPDLRHQPLGETQHDGRICKEQRHACCGTRRRRYGSAAHTGRREPSAWVSPNHRRNAARNLPAWLLVQNPQLLDDSGPTGETGRAGELHENMALLGLLLMTLMIPLGPGRSVLAADTGSDGCAKLAVLLFPLRLRCSKLCPPLFCCLRNPRSRSGRHHPFLPASRFTTATASRSSTATHPA